MKRVFSFSVLLCSVLILSSCCCGKKRDFPTQNEVVEVIKKVNNHWQSTHKPETRSFWHPAAYHTGNIAAYEVTKDDKYRTYSEQWADHNEWKGAKSDDKSEWRYGYGETDKYVLFGDWQICFQVYADLYNIEKDEKKIARAREVMEYQMSTDNNDYWWWADGLYMVMPVMTKMYKITGNELYLEKLHEYFTFAKNLMYDKDEKIFYRDSKYVYPKHKTSNGKKDFWARGNGWVFAGLAKVIEDLPKDNKYRAEYIEIFKGMAASLKQAQQAEGHWTRSLLDPEFATGFETSGTAFFTYAYLWGMNNGFLEEDIYAPVAEKAWKYLANTAVQEDGVLGYVQPIGERANQHQNVGPTTTADFGVGAFLLAASEMYKFVK